MAVFWPNEIPLSLGFTEAWNYSNSVKYLSMYQGDYQNWLQATWYLPSCEKCQVSKYPASCELWRFLWRTRIVIVRVSVCPLVCDTMDQNSRGCLGLSHVRHRDGRFGSKVGQIGPNMGQIRGFFRSDFSAFGAPAPNALKSDLKSPGFVTFGANLTHFGDKPTIPACTAWQHVGWTMIGFNLSLDKRSTNPTDCLLIDLSISMSNYR